MPFGSRIFFAFACFFRVLFDGRFASAVDHIHALPEPGSRAELEQKSGSTRDTLRDSEPDRDTVVDSEAGSDEAQGEDAPSSGREASVEDLSDSEVGVPSASASSDSGLKHRSPPKPQSIAPGPLEAATEEAATEEAATEEAATEEAATEEAATEEAAQQNAEREQQRLRERGGLMLLSLLQREGRFVDFLQQDVTEFEDEQVGAAARVVHEGCRRALKGHLTVTPVRDEQEGDKVSLDEGYDVQANKLVGNVSGKPPYKGTVQHRGWRAEKFALPVEVGDHDAKVLAPAEIEL